MRWLALIALTSGACIDSPTVERPEDDGIASDDQRWPGWCVAESEINGSEGPDGRRVAIYDGDRIIADEFDSDLDGDVDVVTTYFYDEDGSLIRLEIDRFADEQIDEVRQYDWSDDGRLLRESWDTNADAEFDVVITFEHDDEGRQVRGTGRLDDDGVPEIVIRYEWDNGLLTAVHIDGFAGRADGTFERAIFYAYDSAGNLTTALFDFDANGIADMFVTYSYECWTDRQA